MAIYVLPNAEKTAIIERRPDITTKILNHPTLGDIYNPSPEQYYESGWYLWVDQVVGEFQVTGALITEDVGHTATYEVNDIPATDREDILITVCKDHAGELIAAILPSYRQRNHIASAIEIVFELLEKVAAGAYDKSQLARNALSPESRNQLDYYSFAFSQQVKPIRAASDIIEADISAGLITTRDGVLNDPRWII